MYQLHQHIFWLKRQLRAAPKKIATVEMPCINQPKVVCETWGYEKPVWYYETVDEVEEATINALHHALKQDVRDLGILA